MSEPERPSQDGIPTVVVAGARFDGLLCFRGAARVDGTLRGQVLAEGLLVVGPEARVEAQLDIDELVVAGRVEGNVEARGRVEIEASGHIAGTVRSPSLTMADGGVLEGRCETPRSDPSEPATGRSTQRAQDLQLP